MSGPDHARHYVVEVLINGRALGRGEGANRRIAETEAATRALVAIEAAEDPASAPLGSPGPDPTA